MAIKQTSYISPAGIAQYPRLNVPDTKFVPEGVYSARLKFTGEEAQELSAFLDGKLQESIAEAKKDNPGKKIKEAGAPYSWTDEGNLIVNFKMKASGTKDGRQWNRKPALFDAKGKPLDVGITVGGGSKLIVSYTPSAFYTSMLGAGLSMRLEAVQVIDLREGGGGQSSDSFGFKEQDGFEAKTAAFPGQSQGSANDPEDF